MRVDDERTLFETAVATARAEAGRSTDGEGVAAATLTDDGSVLTGVWIDAKVDAACLCAETGPICEAHRTGRSITASICVRWTGAAEAQVLAACGVCQERLAIFGTDVMIAVADGPPPAYRFVALAELRPSPWWDAPDG